MTEAWRAVALAASLAACGPGDPAGVATASGSTGAAPGNRDTTAATSEDVDALVAGNTAFALDLYSRLRETEGNLAFSPASISLALGMTFAGARGDTAGEMARTLHFERAGDGVHPAFGALLAAWEAADGVDLRIANRLFGERSMTFHDPFLERTRDDYGAALQAIDFRGEPDPSRERINRWVEERTEDRIQDLLPAGSIDTDTRLVVANAIYFKGQWRTRFDPSRTRALPFHLAGGGTAPVPTMHLSAALGHAAVDGLQILVLPYAGDALAMWVLLPDERDGLPQLEARLTPDALAGWRDTARDVEVEVLLPRFTIDPEQSVALRETLSEMGMPSAFDRRGDFTGICDERPFHVDDVYHKAFVEVNEEGTEAAAATGAVLGIESVMVTEPPVFRADHPFLFAIVDLRNDSILFLGRIVDPTPPRG